MGSTKTKTSSTTVPLVPDFIKTPYKNYSGRVQKMFDNPYVQPFNAQEQAAYGFTGLGGTKTLGQLSNLNPILANTNKYMNPFTQQVINTSLRDLDRGRQMQITDDQARATAAGAFGGSRHGVADSLTNREFADSAGSMASNLRMQGYGNAQQAALQDAQFRSTNANAYAGNQRQDTALAGELGERQRIRSALQDNSSPEYMAMMAQLLQGMNGQMFTGQKTDGTSKSGGGLGSLLSGVGSAAMMLGSGGLNFGGLFGSMGSAGGAASGFTPGWASGLSKGLM